MNPQQRTMELKAESEQLKAGICPYSTTGTSLRTVKCTTIDA